MNRLQRNVGTAHAVCGFVFLRELVWIDAGVAENAAHRADTAGKFVFGLRHKDRFVTADLTYASGFFRKDLLSAGWRAKELASCDFGV